MEAIRKDQDQPRLGRGAQTLCFRKGICPRAEGIVAPGTRLMPSAARRARRLIDQGEFHLVAVVVIAREFEEFERYRGAGAGDRNLLVAILLERDDFLPLAVEKVP